MYDVVIIGAGPAGLAAALYLLRAEKTVLLLEKAAFGGQMTFSPKIENYPGIESASGNEIAEKLLDQVLKLGAEVELDEALEIVEKNGHKAVKTSSAELDCKAVIIATGAKHRKLGLEREEDFIGDGISFCAVCDGAFYKDKNVAVIGGGNSAKQEALMLAKLAKKVTVVQNLSTLTGEKKLSDSVEAAENIEVIYNSVVTGYLGEESFCGISIENTQSGVRSDIYVDGVFVAIGLEPDCKAFEGVIELDGRGYALSDENCRTKTDGVFVAGDCRTKNIRQISTATADGVNAALGAAAYIDSQFAS